MINWFRAINHWVHLTSAVVWIGGIIFHVIVLFPSLRESAVESGAFLQRVYPRFRRMGGVLLGLLVVTGGINFGFRRPSLGEDYSGYLLWFGLKVVLVVIIATLYLYELQSQHIPSHEEINPSTPLFQKLLLVLGLAIVLTAAILRSWEPVR